MESCQTLGELELGFLKQLVAIPSDTSQGEKEILDYIKHTLQANSALRITSLSGETGLIVEKGTLNEQSACSTLIHGHVDTVHLPDCHPSHIDSGGEEIILEDEPYWPDRYALKIAGDNAHGSGAGDMKGSVAIMMASALQDDPPENTSVTYAFLTDEEGNSEGQKECERWITTERKRYHSCLASDVEPRGEFETDRRQRILLGRRGALKIAGRWALQETHYSHAALGGTNALDTFYEFNNQLRIEFFERYAHSHIYFPNDSLSSRYVHGDQRKEQCNSSGIDFNYCLFLTPHEDITTHTTPMERIEAYLRWFRSTAEEILTRNNWGERNIAWNVWIDSRFTTYPPYWTDESNPIVRTIKKESKKIAHLGVDALIVGAPSNGDSNLFAHFFEQYALETNSSPTPVIELPPYAHCVHSRRECVSLSSLAVLRTLYQKLIEESLPRAIL